MVIVCGVAQSAVVKVNVLGETVAAPESLLLNAIVTVAVGCESNAAVKVPVPDSCSVLDAEDSVMPCVSLSTTLTVMSATLAPVYPPPERVCEIATDSFTASSSLTGLRVTVCAVAQFAAVNVNGLVVDTAPGSALENATETSENGCWVKLTLYVLSAAPPSASATAVFD